MAPLPVVKAFARHWWVLLIRGMLAGPVRHHGVRPARIHARDARAALWRYAWTEGLTARWGGERSHAWSLVRVGVLGVLVGLYTCISSGITTITLLSLIAVWAIIRGLCEMVTAIQLRRERRNAWALIIGGILSVLFGTVLVANPAADALAMIGVIGAYALVFGLMMIVLAFRVRRLPQRLARSPQACAAAPRVVSMNVERKPVGMPRHMFGYTVHIRCQPPRPRENPPMRAALQLSNYKRHTMTDMRALADQAFSRAAGAPLIAGNSVRVLQDARENYPAWLAAIGAAQRHVHFESYILREDEVGQMFAHALLAKAREGVRVRLIYDWMGGFGKTSRAFWQHVRAGGVEVRCYNPPRLDAPLGWLSRDHRKMLSVDGQIGFVTGLCVGRMWVGVPAEQIEPWRDTGVEVRGPAVADIAHAFAHIWAMLGEPLPAHEVVPRDALAPAGTTALRVVASLPATAGLFRLDQLVAALARKRLWLTDAYYAGTTAYVQALCAAAQDGVDVRLLVPNGTDIPLLKPISRAGYPPLLEAGVRVFEWNGTMLHAKTAVADGHWARVGSTNLNLASWLGNCELDVVVEDVSFARAMEEMYLQDLTNATEVILDAKQKVRAPGEPRHPHPVLTSGGGSSGRVAAGAVRIGNAVGAAFTNRRVLEPVEAPLMARGGALLCMVAVLFALFPRVLVYPLCMLCVWLGAALLYRSSTLHRKGKREKS